MYEVIRRIVDDGEYFDLKPQFAKTIITCLARFGGRPAGIVANQPKQLGGILDNDSADKAARFINLCNAYGIPLVFLMDVPGFMVGTKVEEAGIIRHGAKMLYATANATVPKITVVLRKAYGAGYYVMCGRAYEPDLIVAWPSAEISVMGAEGAVEIIFRKQVRSAEDPAAKRQELIENFRKIIDVYVAAGNDMIDDVIDPRETRATICRGLEMAQSKKVERPYNEERSGPGMSLEDPVVITCAISGAIANRDQCPAIPYTPEEYAAEARRIVDEGGVHIHIHARTPDGTPSAMRSRTSSRSRTRSAPRSATARSSTSPPGRSECRSRSGSPTSRPADPRWPRSTWARSTTPSTRASARTSCSSSCSRTRSRRSSNCSRRCAGSTSSPSTSASTSATSARSRRSSTWVCSRRRCTRISSWASSEASPPARSTSPRWRTTCPPEKHHWGVIGIGREQWMLVASALTLGGSIRVGLEDNFYLPDGTMARSNGDLIAKARQMTEDAGRRPATVAEARALLGIKTPVES